MEGLKYNLYLKILVIFFIALLLLIPATMVKRLITERESTQKEAIISVFFSQIL